MGQCELCASEIAAESGRCPRCVDAAPGIDELIGQVIFGRYTLVRLLAEGGMGRVYVAEQAVGTITRPVAVKVLRPQLGTDKQLLGRFSREAETLVRLTHPNTVHLFDFGALPDGTLALVMEYVEGHSLSRELSAGPLPIARVERLLAQLCGALREAHAHGIVHRDLKPDNLLIARRLGHGDLLKVLDFGIAKVSANDEVMTTKLTQQGMIIGTPPYMSPEQFSGEAIDARSDIYSLAMIVFEMLTGRLPFEAKTPWEWASKHLTQIPEPLPLDPERGIVERHAHAIASALAKRAGDRPQTVDAFLDLFGVGTAPSTESGLRMGSGMEARPVVTPAPSSARVPSGSERAAPMPTPAGTGGGHAARTPTPTGPGPTLQEELPLPVARRGRTLALAALVALVVLGGGALALRGGSGGETPVPAPAPSPLAEQTPPTSATPPPPLPSGVAPPEPIAAPTARALAGTPAGTRERTRPRSRVTSPSSEDTTAAPVAPAAPEPTPAPAPPPVRITSSNIGDPWAEGAPSAAEPRAPVRLAPAAREPARAKPAPVPEDLQQRVTKIRDAMARPEVAVGLYQAAAARYGNAQVLVELRAGLTGAGERRERELVGQGRCAQAQALHRALTSAGAAPSASVFSGSCKAP